MVKVALGKLEEASQCLTQSLGLNPKDALVWHYRGYFLGQYAEHLEKQGLLKAQVMLYYEEALSCLDRSVALDQESAKAWTTRGMVLRLLGRSQEALSSLEQAMELTPGDVGAWVSKAKVLGDLGEYEPALEVLEHAESLHPGHPDVRDQRIRLKYAWKGIPGKLFGFSVRVIWRRTTFTRIDSCRIWIKDREGYNELDKVLLVVQREEPNSHLGQIQHSGESLVFSHFVSAFAIPMIIDVYVEAYDQAGELVARLERSVKVEPEAQDLWIEIVQGTRYPEMD